MLKKLSKILFTSVLCVLTVVARTACAQDRQIELEVSESIVDYQSLQQRKIERRIDSMDVYALAPSAYKLRYGHMLSDELYKNLKHKKIKDLIDPIARASRASGLEAELIAAVIYVESGFRVEAVSPKGATGLMQLMPGTLADLGVKNPYDIDENIQAGSTYLKEQILRFASLEKALAAYNAGPGHVLKYKGIPPFKETMDFVRKVLVKYEQYKNSGLIQ